MGNKSGYTTELYVEALKKWKPSATQEEISCLKIKYNHLLNGHRSRGNPFHPQLVKLKGNNGEIAYIENESTHARPNRFKLIIEFTKPLIKIKEENWKKTALKFFNPHFFLDTEIVPQGNAPRKITKRPYHIFETRSSEFGDVQMYYKKYSDKKPWGTKNSSDKIEVCVKRLYSSNISWGTSQDSKKKRAYRKNRNSWMKNKYKELRKKKCQDDAYDSIKIELQNLPIEYFGEWPSKTRDSKSSKWIPTGTDPRKLKADRIKDIVQRKS